MISFNRMIAAIGMFSGVVAAGSAHAAPVVFDDNPETAQARIVRSLFPGYISERPGMVLESSVLDLDLDDTGEIIARFVHSGSCSRDMKTCRTVVLKHFYRGTTGNWKIIFDRATSAIEFGAPQRRLPAPITADGITWTYTYPNYKPTSSDLGMPINLERVPPQSVRGIAGAFGEGALKLAETGSDRVSYEYGAVKTEDGNRLLIIKQTGDMACGDLIGCPVRVIREANGKWATVLEAATVSDVLQATAMRKGLPDLVTNTPNGFVVFGWAGEQYGIVDRVEAVEVRK
ncbi:hypothetical protein [Roseibium sp. RKSG952]|uniref:hypothetical protein n=1 Tax=Roseibium sp. RKSG952 TaxID=2529384 RepID=UPI0012BC1140|nr:hypothetical protein [Roseibium sp. RKSG952]MTH96700.1 hypothetical protein [Roseibium sp. RKSG952]